MIAALAGRLTPSSGRARHAAAYEVGQERTTLLSGGGSLVSVTRAVAGLEEPSNDLDIDALEALEAALKDWPGALVVATHDVRLRDALQFDRTLEIRPV